MLRLITRHIQRSPSNCTTYDFVLELSGPMCMSYAATSNIQYRLAEADGGTVLTMQSARWPHPRRPPPGDGRRVGPRADEGQGGRGEQVIARSSRWMALGDGEVDGRDHELRAADDHEGERPLNLAARLAKRQPGHRDRHDPVDRAVNRRVPRPETRASVEPVGESRGRGTAETQAWLHDNGRVLKMLAGVSGRGVRLSRRQEGAA